MLLRWLQRDLRNHWRFTLFFAINLSLGLIGFTALDSLQTSLSRSFQDKAKETLSADLVIKSRQQLTVAQQDHIRNIIPEQAKRSELISLYSMAASNNQSRLVSVHAIGKGLPFYGEMTLKANGTFTGANSTSLFDKPSAWIQPELALQMDLDIGDSLKIGDLSFEIIDFIEKDPTNTFAAFAMAPRVYIALPFLDATNLIQKGSRVDYHQLFRLPTGDDVLQKESALKATLIDPRIRIKSYESASEDLSRVLAYLSDFLNLVALAALFLAGIGITYLFRNYLLQRYKDIAIFKSLGLTRKRIIQFYLLKLFSLGCIGASLTTLLTIALMPVLGKLLQPVFPGHATPSITAESILFTFLVATLACVLVCLPSLIQTTRIRTMQLFQSMELPACSNCFRDLCLWIPIGIAYWLLAVLQARSLKLGSLFIVVFLLAMLTFLILARCLPYLVRWVANCSFVSKYAVNNLIRSKASTATGFVVIALGALLINLIPQLYSNLNQEFTTAGGGDPPSLFLFDIQPEQIEAIKKAALEGNTELSSITPMIMSRLMMVNGREFGREREEDRFESRENERRQGLVNRTFNLTYRQNLLDSETIIKGEPFSGRYDPTKNTVAEISMERRFAKRLKFKIGDILEFDVQGISVQGKIVNLRSVRWTTFQPGFFIQFHEGLLEGAPKTFIATVPKLTSNAAMELQNQIVREFPNVSIIDVSAAVKGLLHNLELMSQVIKIMAYLVFLVGLCVLFTIVRHQSEMRRFQIGLLKTLGASLSEIKQSVQLEFGLIAGFAILFGALVSLFASYLFAEFVFDSVWQPDLTLAVLVSTICLSLSMLIVTIASQRALGVRAKMLLEESAHA